MSGFCCVYRVRVADWLCSQPRCWTVSTESRLRHNADRMFALCTPRILLLLLVHQHVHIMQVAAPHQPQQAHAATTWLLLPA